MLFFETPFKLFPDLLEPPPYNGDTKMHEPISHAFTVVALNCIDALQWMFGMAWIKLVPSFV